MSVDLPPVRAETTRHGPLVRPLLGATVFGLLASELLLSNGAYEAGLFGYVAVLAVAGVAGTARRESVALLIPATVASWRLVAAGLPSILGVDPVVVAYLATVAGVAVLVRVDPVAHAPGPSTTVRRLVDVLVGVEAGFLGGVLLGLLAGGGDPVSFALPRTPVELLVVLAVVTLAAVVDELLFRRLLYDGLRGVVDRRVAFVAVALVYGVLAPATGQFPAGWLALVVAVVLGAVYALTDDVFGTVAAHAGIVAGLVVAPVLL